MDRIVELTIENLRKHHFNADFFNSVDECFEYLSKKIKINRTIAFGGSMTLQQSGLKDRIIAHAEKYIERIADNEESKLSSERMALQADLYFAGINAISSDGIIVNIDKRGNRVGAITFGPKEVILVSSVKKIRNNLNDAIERAKNTAAVKNCERFNLKTPCITTGHCIDCEHNDTICYVTVITRMCYPHNRITVCLIDEDYGY